jgi:flagellar basal body-associated protein FliL
VAKETPEAAPPKAAKESSSFPLIPLINSLALLGTLGLLVYSKLIFKRPVITEESERKRIEAIQASPTPPSIPGLVAFEAITVNISTHPADGKSDTTDGPGVSDAPKPQKKSHYATLAFSLEIRDNSQRDLIEEVKPYILDKIITLVGKKDPSDLIHVQGRYILHSQMIDTINQVIRSVSKKNTKEGFVTNVYFTQFVVQ